MRRRGEQPDDALRRLTAEQRLDFAVACLAAAAILVAAYSNHFANGFHVDDGRIIVNNPAIREVGDVAHFFTERLTSASPQDSASYHPLLTLSYALDYRAAGGLEPGPFHRTQLGLLVLVGALLVPFYRGLLDRAESCRSNAYVALFAATLFCVHTANTATVNCLASRSNLLATLGVVGSLLLYQSWPRGRPSGLYLLPMLVAGLASTLSVVFAPLLWVYVLLFEERWSVTEVTQPRGWWKMSASLLRCAPAFAVSGVLYLFLSRMNPDTPALAGVDRWRYLAAQPFVWLDYFHLFFWPRGLTAVSDPELLSRWYDVRSLLGFLFVVALAVVTLVLTRSRQLRPVSFGLAWFVITLMSTSAVIPQSGVYSEQRIFLPYVGLTLATTWAAILAVRRWVEPREWAGERTAVVVALAGVAIVAGHGLGTHIRNEAWLNEESLLRDGARKIPGKGDLLFARWLTENERGPEAVSQLETAVRAGPDDSDTRGLLLQYYAALGREQSLVELARRTLEIAPSDRAAASYARGEVPYDVKGKTLGAYLATGRRSIDDGRWLEGAILNRHALVLDPTSAVAWNNLGWALGNLGFYDEAANCFREASRLDPEMKVATSNLAWAAARSRRDRPSEE